MFGSSPRYCAVHNEDPCVTCAIYPARSVSYTLVRSATDIIGRPTRVALPAPLIGFASDVFRRVRSDERDPGDEDAS